MKKSMKKRAIALGLSAAMVVTSYPAALVSAEDGFVAAEIFEGGGTEELTFEEEPFSEETLDGFGAEEFTGAEGFFEEEEAAADVFEAEASAVLAEDEREAVAMSIAPEQKDWYIWEQTGDDWRSNPAGFDGEYYNQFKITWADGEESYISSGVSTRGDFLKDEKGEWIAGEGHKIVWEYQKLTVELPIYVVRIGQNGSDLLKDTPKTETAGNKAPAYKYYRIRPGKEGAYEFDFTNVSGTGTAGLYVQNTIGDGWYQPHHEPLKTRKISGEDKLTYKMEADTDYFLVVQADTADNFKYDVCWKDLNQELILEQEVPVEGEENYSFTPKQSGFYSVSFSGTSEVRDENGNLIGYPNRTTSYFVAGKKYLVNFKANWGTSNYKVEFESAAELPADTEWALKDGGVIFRMNGAGVLTCYSVDGMTTYLGSSFLNPYLRDNTEVKELVVEEGFTTIGYQSFYGLEGLRKVFLPSSLTTIGMFSFKDCTNLETVTVGENSALENIGEVAFYGTKFIENLDMDGYSMIGPIVLAYRGEETNTLVPGKATIIANGAMRDKDTLEKITIQKKLKKIGEFGMAECDKLAAMDVPGNVTRIEYCAFYSDSALENAVLNEGVEYVGEEAFFACNKLKTITIPKSVYYIGEHAIGYSYGKYEGLECVYHKPENLPLVKCYYSTPGYDYAKSNGLPYELLDPKDIGNPKVCAVSVQSSGNNRPTVSVVFAKTKLKENTDYTVQYIDLDDGTTDVIVTGKGEYFGSRTFTVGNAKPTPTPTPKPTAPPQQHTHSFGAWKTTAAATVFAPEKQERTCSCGKVDSRTVGSKLKSIIKLNVNTKSTLPLKVKQTLSTLKVTQMAAGDSVKSWKSSNTKIVSVSGKANGTCKLTPKKAGTATITITMAGGASAKVKVQVKTATVKTTSVTGIAKKLTLQKGKTSVLKPVVAPISSKEKVTYTSSNKKVATVTSKGVVKAVNPGTAKITVKSGTKKAYCTVKVTGIPATKITGVPSTKTLKVRKTTTLKPKLSPKGCTDKITYKSSNTKVATVTSKGKVTAKKKGTAYITVKAGKISKKCKIVVK